MRGFSRARRLEVVVLAVLGSVVSSSVWADAAPAAIKPAQSKSAASTTAKAAVVTAKPVAAPKPVTTAKTAGKTLALNFRDADIDEVLRAYALASGLTVVKDPAVKGTVTIISSGRLSLDQAFDVLSSMLSVRGFVLRPSARLLTVIPVSKASEPGVLAGQSSGGAKADKIVTQVIALKRSNALELQRELAPMVSENASLMASAQTNTLVVTDFAPKVQQLVSIVDELEKGGAGQSGASGSADNAGGRNQRRTDTALAEVIYVKYANATDLARSLSTLFTSTGNGRNDQGGNQGGQGANQVPFEQRLMGGGAGGQGQNGGGGGGQAPVQVVPGGNAAAQGGGGAALLAMLGQNFGNGASGLDAGTLARLAQAAGLAGGQGSGGSSTIPTRIVADTYSNSLMVSGSAESIAAIKTLVASVDQGGAASITSVYRVRYGRAVDLANTVLNLYGVNQAYQSTAQSGLVQGAAGSTQARPAVTTGTAATRPQGNSNNNNSNRNNSNSNNNNRQQQNSNQRNNNSGSNNNQNLQRLLSAFTGQGGSAAGGGTRNRPRINSDFKVVPDEPTNTIVLSGPKEILDEIKDLLVQLDVAPPQVHIEAIIAEVSLDQGDKMGISWDSIAKSPAITGSATSWAGDPIGGLKYQVISGGISAILETIKTDSRFRVLSTPSVMTVNNSQANMYVGKQIPYVNATTRDANGNVQSTYAYRDVGVTLQVFPRITESGYISLDIYQDSSEVVATSTAEVPAFSSRNARTSVMVKHGETVVIGGIIREDKTEQVRKLPLLGDIPYLGALFRRKEQVSSKTELMVFITPQIVRGPNDAVAISNDTRDGLSEYMQDTVILPRPVPTLEQNGIEEKLKVTQAAEAVEAAQRATEPAAPTHVPPAAPATPPTVIPELQPSAAGQSGGTVVAPVDPATPAAPTVPAGATTPGQNQRQRPPRTN